MKAKCEIVEFIAIFNAMFDWQISNFLLKASVQMLLVNKEIKWKSGLHFCFLFLTERFWDLKMSQYSSYVRSHLQKKFNENRECLQMCYTTFKANV